MSTFTFEFENGTTAIIRGKGWGKILGEALHQARTRGRIVRYY